MRAMKFAAMFILGAVAFLTGCSRAPEFLAQAQAGQPIVRAIDQYHTDKGSYPAFLSDLVPNYLTTAPETPDESKHKFTGWDYRPVTNGLVVSYSLRFYMGKGGVEYEPPNWIGNDEGHRTVILSNEK
jgi:hypothetical protein